MRATVTLFVLCISMSAVGAATHSTRGKKVSFADPAPMQALDVLAVMVHAAQYEATKSFVKVVDGMRIGDELGRPGRSLAEGVHTYIVWNEELWHALKREMRTLCLPTKEGELSRGSELLQYHGDNVVEMEYWTLLPSHEGEERAKMRIICAKRARLVFCANKGCFCQERLPVSILKSSKNAGGDRWSRDWMVRRLTETERRHTM